MKKLGLMMTTALALAALSACGGNAQKPPEPASAAPAAQEKEGEAPDASAQAMTPDEPEREATETPEEAGTYDYDMYGFVVDKLPTEEYYNHYNVKGDNDEIYICNYNGTDELAAGTYVGMLQIEDGWTLEVLEQGENAPVAGDVLAADGDLAEMEDFFSNMDLEAYEKMILEQAKEGEKRFPVTLDKQDSSKEVNPVEGGLFITADKVECRSMELAFSGDVLSFGIELYNETGTDQTFDQTKFVLEKQDGVLLNPFVFEQVREPETVRAQSKRLWMAYTVYDPKGLNPGDEVSVYYDGVFITTLKVEK